MVSNIQLIRAVFLTGLVCLLGLLPRVSNAQSQFLNMAPLNKVAWVSHASDLDATNILVGIERSMPIGALLPQVTPDSYLEFLRLVGGVNQSDGDTRIRGRATAVGFEIQKMPWAAAFSVLDFDASGLQSFSADWISLGIGPGLDGGNRDFRFSGRVIGISAFNSTRFGSEILGFSEETADRTTPSLLYGIRAIASLNIQERFLFAVNYTLNRYSVDSDIERKILGASLNVQVIPTVQILGAYERLSFQLHEDEIEFDGLRFGLTISPAAPR